ncbi:hypothetical protein [Kocuria sp. KH4]
MGVLVESPEGWHMRFAALKPDGKVDGRRLRAFQVDKHVYQSWVDYYSRRAMAGKWEEVEAFQRRRGGNFRVIKAGLHMRPEENWSLFTDVLFQDLVQQPPGERNTLEDRVRAILTKALIPAEEEVEVPGKWRDDDDEVMIPFDFGLTREHYQVMELVSAQPTSILGLKARIDAVTRVDPKTELVAFVSHRAYKSDSALDKALRPIEAIAHAIDIDNEDEAADQLREIVDA